MSTVFDRDGLVIPLSEVERAERTELGRLRVHMKGGDYVMVPLKGAEDFITMLKDYHEKKSGKE